MSDAIHFVAVLILNSTVSIKAFNKMYIESKQDLAINTKLLLDADEDSLTNTLRQQLEIDPKHLEEMMRTVYDWYRKEPHLPQGPQEIHRQFVVRLLILRKFSIEEVKRKIDNFYSAGPKMPEILCNRDPMEPSLNSCLQRGYWVILPKMAPGNQRITIYRMNTMEDITVTMLCKAIFMIIEYRMWNDYGFGGEHLILDYTNVTFQLAVQMTPVAVTKMIHYVVECLGARPKGIHIINLPSFAEILLAAIKKIMKPKLARRIHIYKSFDEVLEKIPKSIFPKDLGGTDNVTCQEITDAWVKTLCSPEWRKYFIDGDSIHTDESKRRIPKNFNENFGLDGSFKTLSID